MQERLQSRVTDVYRQGRLRKPHFWRDNHMGVGDAVRRRKEKRIDNSALVRRIMESCHYHAPLCVVSGFGRTDDFRLGHRQLHIHERIIFGRL
jgi:hypothetical protein